jgi:hypothetical protein
VLCFVGQVLADEISVLCFVGHMEPTKILPHFRRLDLTDENIYYFRQLFLADEINIIFSSASFGPTKIVWADEIA